MTEDAVTEDAMTEDAMTEDAATEDAATHNVGTDYLHSLFSLSGKVALVTGGSSGIGKGMARALAGAGATVIVLARQVEPLDQTVAEFKALGGQAERISADLADPAAIDRVATEILDRLGALDILVNAAGINLRPPLPEVTSEDWDQTMAVNLAAPFRLAQHFGPLMAERGWGRIINVLSQQAYRAFGNSGAYGASKGGLLSLTRSQAEAWSKHGVCCNAVVPGFVPSAMTAAVAADPVRSAALAERTMIGRNGRAEDFEGATVFLASDACTYVTGQAIFIDGGLSAS